MANETIDTRVVQMEFDNRQFEKNIKQTSKSLDNLKQSLDFKGVGDSVDEVRLRISALQIAATTFIANIANKITNLGIIFIKSLSIDNISSGWSKFGEKTTSIATMMAQKIRIAGQEITDLAEKTAIVNEQMELLTWFSDETSYSFTDMVNNVSKFTAAGQDLDKSVKAMEGIATWAAASGQNAQTASVAMYQLAQAMSAGTVKLQDWKSIQNANMDTEEFRDKILETAVAMGQLTKEGDQFVTKTGKKFTKAQFTTQLSEGWFTSDVLIEGLNKYSAAIDEIYEISQREGITASEVIEKYGDTLDQFGVKAFKAAQEARTFTDVLNSVKDAVSSKWMTTFENIFGNQQEAVKLWTDLANELYDVFAESGNFRNDILAVWKELGGRDDLFAKGGDNQGAFWNIYDAIIAVRDIIKSAWRTIFPLSEMESLSDQAEDVGRRLKGITERIRNFTSTLKTSSALTIRLSKILQTIFSVVKMTINAIKILRYILDPVVVLIKELTNQILDKLAFLGNKVSSSVSLIENIVIKLHDILEGIIDDLALPDFLEDIFDTISKVFKTISDTKPLSKIFEFIKTFVKSFKDSIKQGGLLESVIKVLKDAFSILFKLLQGSAKILSAILPIIFNILNSIGKLAGSLSGTFANILISIVNFIGSIVEFVKNSGIIESTVNVIISIIARMSKILTPIFNFVLKMAKVILSVVKKIIDAIASIFDGLTSRISEGGLLKSLGTFISGFFEMISNFFKGVWTISTDGSIFDAIKSLLSGILEVIKSILPVLSSIIKEAGKLLQNIGKLISAVIAAISNTLSSKETGNFTSFVIRLGLLLLTMFIIYKLLTSVGKMLTNINWILEAIEELARGAVRYLKAAMFKEIAKALLFAAAAIVLIAQVDDKAMIDALAAVIILAGIMLGIVSIINNMASTMSAESVKSMAKILTAFRSISFSLVIMSAALSNIAKIDVAAQDKALKTILILLGSFILVINYLNNFRSAENEKAESGAWFIASLSGSLLLMAIALRLLSGQPWQGILAGMGALILTLISFAGIIAYINKNITKNMEETKAAISLIGSIAGSLILMAISLRLLSSQPWQGILAGMGALILTLISFAVVTAYLNKNITKNMEKTKAAISLIGSIAGSLLLMAIALRLLSGQPWKNILISVGIMMAAIVGIIAIVMILNKVAGTMDISLTFFKLAAAMLVLGIALSVLSSGFKSFNKVDFASIFKGLIAFAGALLILGVVSKIVERTAIGVIFKVAASLALIGVGLLAAGIGLTYFGSGLMKMVDVIGPLLELITVQLTNLVIQVVEGLIAALPRIIEALGPVVDSIAQLVPKILELVTVIIEGILDLLDEEGPHIIETVITLIDTLLKTINDHMGSIADSVFGILKTILQRLAANIEELGQSLVDIIIGLVKTLTKNIGPLTKVLIDFLIEATIALFEHIGPLIDIVTDYVFDFIARVTVALTGKLIALAGLITKVVLIVLAAVIRLTIASLGALSKLFVTFVSALLLILVHTFISLSNVLFEVFKVMIKESLKLLVEVIIYFQDAFVAIGKMMVRMILRGIIATIQTIGGWLIDLIDRIFGTNIGGKLQAISDNLANEARSIVSNLEGGTDRVQAAISTAANNINDVVSMTADAANEAVISGMGAISDTVSDSMDQLGDAMQQFGEEAGSNLYTGMGSSDNIDGANQVGQDMGNATAEGFAEATETHSPSRLFARFGRFLMEGLGLGIQNGASETEAVMAEVIGDSLQLATDILDGQEGDDYTIKVGMDISSVEAQTSRIQDIMSGVNDPSITASGRNAGYNARALECNNRGSETVNNDHSTTVTYNNTFNIESTDPQQSADEIDKVLKEQNTRFKLAHGT